MAIGDILGPFIWGEGGQKLSPEEVARQRALASQLASQVGDTSPVGHWTQGLTRMTEALRGNLTDWRANQAEQAGLAEAQSAISPILAALGGGASVPSSYGQSQTVSAPQTARASNLSSEPVSGDGWLRYANSGATRNQQLAPELVNALGFLPELGVEMEVFSGGQPSAGNGARVGSDRHDHGNAADVFFYKDGRRLDWANPNDLPLFEEIVRRGKSAGITGFGAGDGYMQPGSMHIGFGPNAVWGAGGKGANAPEWLRSAYTSPMQGNSSQPKIGNAALEAIEQASPQEDQAFAASSPQVQQQAVQAIQSNPAQAGDLLASILQAQANPWAQKQYGSVLNTLMTNELNQRNQANDPLRQLQIQQAQLHLDQARNPYQATPATPDQLAQWGIDPNAQGWTIGPDGTPQQVYAPQQPKPIEVGGVLVDPVTYEPLFDSRQGEGSSGFTLGSNQIRYDQFGNEIARGIIPPSLDAPTTKQVKLSDGSEALVQWNPETQVWDPAPLPQGGTGGTGSPIAKLTENQAKTTLFQTLQNETSPILSTIEQIWDPSNIADNIARATPIGGNFFQSEQGQIYNSAAGAWAEGALRISTGAAATEPEIERIKQVYFAQPGDTPNVVQFKKGMRDMYTRAINASLGQDVSGQGELVLPEKFAERYIAEIKIQTPQIQENQYSDPMFDGAFNSIQQTNPNQPMGSNALNESTMLETLIGNESTYNPIPIGTIEDGWIYIGGNPAQQQSWQRAR